MRATETIRNWHPGQLVLLWIGAAVIEWLVWQWWMVIYPEPTLTTLGWTIGLILLFLIPAIPITMFFVTWKWFGGRNG